MCCTSSRTCKQATKSSPPSPFAPVPQYCVRVSPNGTARVAPSPTDEPLILVPKQWVKPASFFVPIPAREVRWAGGAGGRVAVWRSTGV